MTPQERKVMEHYEAALKVAFPSGATGDVFYHWNEARKLLEQQPADEPVAWFIEGSTYHSHEVALKMNGNVQQGIMPLYTHPQKAAWVGLTDEEVDDIWNRYCDEMGEASINDAEDIYLAIEAKLKEKNQ